MQCWRMSVVFSFGFAVGMISISVGCKVSNLELLLKCGLNCMQILVCSHLHPPFLLPLLPPEKQINLKATGMFSLVPVFSCF